MDNLEVCQKPWGTYTNILDSDLCKVKIIEIKPQCQPSYQYHHKRQEAWTVVSGIARITIDDETKDYHAGDTVLIPLGAKHRMANPENDQDMILIEVQTGTYFGEDDIVRVQDDYDRPESHEVINLWKPKWDISEDEKSK